jgi:hypothetical protein
MVMWRGYMSLIPSVRPLVSSGLLKVNNNNYLLKTIRSP